MKQEIWQTTNQQPWVEAVLSQRTTVKTRTSRPVVPVGATVLLHASKTMWPGWRELSWTPNYPLDLGMIVGVARVSAVGPSRLLLSAKERKVFELPWGSCAAEWGVKFDRCVRLTKPVATKGFLAPFARAKSETVRAVLEANPYLWDLDWRPFQ